MPKERNFNPVQAQHKADKARSLKKSRAQLATQRAEKLARRNPDRLQRQIDALTAERDAAGGQLRPRDKQQLEQLERDVAAIRKAREKTGTTTNDNSNARESNGNGVLGKRRRDHDGFDRRRREHSFDSVSTDPDVRGIPMPRDTPPPIPRRDYKKAEGNAGGAEVRAAPQQTTYEAAPQLRNLRKEATAFVPAAVAQRLKAVRAGPGGRLLEEEEMAQLERGGYLGGGSMQEESKEREQAEGDMQVDLEEEETRWRREMHAQELKDGAKRDAEQASQAAVEEAHFRLMSDEAAAGSSGATGAITVEKTERRLQQVEIEEVEDEDA